MPAIAICLDHISEDNMFWREANEESSNEIKLTTPLFPYMLFWADTDACDFTDIDHMFDGTCPVAHIDGCEDLDAFLYLLSQRWENPLGMWYWVIDTHMSEDPGEWDCFTWGACDGSIDPESVGEWIVNLAPYNQGTGESSRCLSSEELVYEEIDRITNEQKFGGIHEFDQKDWSEP